MSLRLSIVVAVLFIIGCGLLGFAQDAPVARKPSEPPALKKVWLSHSGTKPFVPLAKDRATFTRMVKVFQINDTRSAAAVFEAKEMIPLEIGTQVNLVSSEGQMSLVEIPTGQFTGTKWFVHSSFVLNQEQVRVAQAKAKSQPKRRATMADVDASFNQMYSQWQSQIAAQEAAYQAELAQKSAQQKATTDAIMRNNQRVASMHYCLYGRGSTNTQCKNIVSGSILYCHLHRLTIE